MPLQIYHNPRCSKSRQTLALLKERGHEPEIIEYLKDIPTISELKNLVYLLGMDTAQDMMRTGEAIYKELGLKMVTDEQKLYAAMAEYPKLIERPIVVNDGKAAIGRPPETVLALF